MKLSQNIGKLIQTTDLILEDETFLDPGMIGILIGVECSYPDVWDLHIDLRPYKDYNLTKQRRNYKNPKSKTKLLTAEEAGYWEDVMTIYIEPTGSDRFQYSPAMIMDPLHYWNTSLEAPRISFFESERDFSIYKRNPFPETWNAHIPKAEDVFSLFDVNA
jgi:hypothetical protein